jgi:hypothetical protein
MSEALKEELARVRDSLRAFRERETELAQKLGETPTSDIATARRAETERATLFDQLTSAELAQLYETNREEWQRVLDAKESSGLRKLMGRR